MITLPCPDFAGLQKGCEWFAKGQRKGGFEGPWLWTILYIYICYTHNIQSTRVRVHMYVCVCIYIYIFISEERVWSPQYFCWSECAQCSYSWTRTLLRGLWNVHNFWNTCTTSVKRAQLLGNVHNISDTCTTSLKRAQHLWNLHNNSETCRYRILENTGWGLWNTLYPYVYI